MTIEVKKRWGGRALPGVHSQSGWEIRNSYNDDVCMEVRAPKIKAFQKINGVEIFVSHCTILFTLVEGTPGYLIGEIVEAMEGFAYSNLLSALQRVERAAIYNRKETCRPREDCSCESCMIPSTTLTAFGDEYTDEDYLAEDF